MKINTRWDDLKHRLQQTTLAAQASAAREAQRKSQIYRQRAAVLAAPNARAGAQRPMTQTLVFKLGSQRFGLPLLHVAQVYPQRPLTAVPRTPSWILGIANFDSQIRSVIDLAELLGVPRDRLETAGNILLVRSSGSMVAARVDLVEEVQQIDFSKLVAPDQQPDTANTRLIRGMTPEHLGILCADALLACTQSSCGDVS